MAGVGYCLVLWQEEMPKWLCCFDVRRVNQLLAVPANAHQSIHRCALEIQSFLQNMIGLTSAESSQVEFYQGG